MQIVTGRRGEPHVTSRQMQAVYRSFLGDFALLDIGEKLRAEAYSNDIVRVYDGVVSVQGIYAVISYDQYDEVYIEPVSVGKKRIDTIVLHYTKDNTLDVEDMQLDVVQGEEYTDNPIAPVVPEGGDAWEGTTDIQVAIYDVEVTNFGLTVTPYARMLTVIPTLDSIAERIPETVVTGVKGDSEVLYRDGDVNITKANIGLGSVDNTADTDKPISTATQTALNLKADLTYVDAKISAAYHAGGSKTVAELTSALLITENMGKVYNMSDSGVTTSDFVEGAGYAVNEGDNVVICNVGTEESPVYKFDLLSGFVDLSAYYTKTESDNKYVTKETGKGLSTEDYTTADKTKLAGISEGATQTIANPADTATETLSKLKVGGVVYDVPQGASGATELSELTDVNLSNVEDNNILQYDETANKWKNSNALQGAKTATGNPITLTDAAPVNAVNLSMGLEPSQDLHGYDHPWVGGAGKNKFIIPNLATLKALNTEGTWNDNVYNLYGISFTINTDNDGNVTSLKVNGTSNDWSSLFFTPTERKTLDNYGLIVGSSYVFTNGLASDVSEIELIINGANTNIYASASGRTFTVDSIDTYYYNLRVRPNTTINNVLVYPMIRLATDTDSTFAPYTNICPISGYDETSVVVKDTADNPTVTDTYTLQFGETVYGAEVDFVSGVARVKMIQSVITGGVEGGNIGANGLYIGIVAGNAKPSANNSAGNIISDKLQTVTADYQWVNTNNSVSINNIGYVKVCIENITSNSDLNTYLASNPVQICYELATPYTIQLTPQQIKLLENTNTLSSDGTITLEYQPNNAIGEAVRAVEESYDPEFAVRPVLKKKSFSGTTDSDGSVTLINASDIPSGHKIIPLQITDMTIGGSAGTYFVEYEPYNSGDSVKGYCYAYFNGSQITPVGSAVTGNFYYYELEV